MSLLYKSLFISLGVHLLIIGIAVYTTVNDRSMEPVKVVDLSMLNHTYMNPFQVSQEPDSGKGRKEKNEEAHPPKVEPKKRKAEKQPEDIPKSTEPRKTAAQTYKQSEPEKVVLDTEEDANDVAGLDADSTDNATDWALAGAGSDADGESGSDGGSADGSGFGQGGYQGYYFGYINETIHKNASYPLQARRMGWEGTVTVSFIIETDGKITDISIMESSGLKALDKSAVSAVKKAGKLPKPQETVQINIPIVYKLTN